MDVNGAGLVVPDHFPMPSSGADFTLLQSQISPMSRCRISKSCKSIAHALSLWQGLAVYPRECKAQSIEFACAAMREIDVIEFGKNQTGFRGDPA